MRVPPSVPPEIQEEDARMREWVQWHQDYERRAEEKRAYRLALDEAPGLAGLTIRTKTILAKSAPEGALTWSVSQWQQHARGLDVAGLREVPGCGPLSLHEIAEWLGGVWVGHPDGVGTRFCFSVAQADKLLAADIKRIEARIAPEIKAARERYAIRVERLTKLENGEPT